MALTPRYEEGAKTSSPETPPFTATEIKQPTPSDTQRLEAEEVAKHTIKWDTATTDRELLERVAQNLNGKTEAIAKMRRGITGVIAWQKKSDEIFHPMILSHNNRFERFDKWCDDSLAFAHETRKAIFDVIGQAVKKAIIIFICVVILYYVLYPLWNYSNPRHTLPAQNITPSPSS